MSQMSQMFTSFAEKVTNFIHLAQLLPLLVYLLVYISTQANMAKLYKLPEWMFVAVILHSDIVRKLLLLYRGYQGFPLKMVRTLSFGILGIVTCCIFLVLSLLALEKPNFDLPPTFYRLQMLMFALALSMSAFTSIWIASRGRDAELLRKMIPGSTEEPDRG